MADTDCQMWFPDEQLDTATAVNGGLNPARTTWPAFRQSLAALGAAPLSPSDRDLLLTRCELLRSGQRHRKDYLKDLKRKCAEHETLTLQLAVRDIRRYQDGVRSELETIKTCGAPVECIQVFEHEIEYSEDSVLYIEDALSKRRDSTTGLKVQSITSKIQMQIALKQACEDLKQRSPIDFHADIDRAFRQAIDAVSL